MSRIIGPGLFAVLCMVGWTELTMAGAAKGNAEAGKKIYLESCQSCHGPTGKGDSDMAAYLTPPPANLTAKGTQSKTDAQLRKTILEGRPGTAMSSFDGAFEEAQIADLLAYIRSLKP
ncbi:MAG: cytochrome c [Nitrospira sp.]|nr:cytochrome c [Nitrospira sp.]